MDLTSFSYLYFKYSPSFLSRKKQRMVPSRLFCSPVSSDCPRSMPRETSEGIDPVWQNERNGLLDHGMSNLTTMIRTMRINNLLIQTFPIRSE